VQRQLIETIETETAVKLFTARSMPQASDAQRSERLAAIQLALRASADVPLEVMRLCAQGLDLATTIAKHGARAASADVQLGVALLQAGFDGARSNLECFECGRETQGWPTGKGRPTDGVSDVVEDAPIAKRQGHCAPASVGSPMRSTRCERPHSHHGGDITLAA
jgi:hypothetical protein